VIIPTKVNFHYAEQCINNVLMLKAFVDSIKPLWQALAGVGSGELQKIRQVFVERGCGKRTALQVFAALCARELQ
jgi:DNA mismatch repair protein MSH4